MIKIASHLTVVCLLALSFAPAAFAQKIEQQADFSGTWQVTVRMRGKTITEQWTLKQTGDKITGTIKGPNGELPVTGEVNLMVLRATYKVGDVPHRVGATLYENEMDGSVVLENADRAKQQQFLWSAKRAGS
jgi:hypothetical protein